ncbi:MAG: response regulator transcription factor [Bacteroidales bacterium]|nr:response regulator transcription factor [Bacteroidales bacterium]
MDEINIIIVDDHALFRNGLNLLLNNFENINILAEAENGLEFLNIIEKAKPDIVLIDIDMPVMDGIEATEKAIIKYPDLKLIALSMFGDEDYYYKMINAGVKGFLLKNSEIREVINAINTVYKGGTFFSQDLLINLVKNIKPLDSDSDTSFSLSERELEVLSLICQGFSNQEIGDKLFISKRTVDKHRSNLLSKTNSKNTANLVIYAIRNKLFKL